MIKEFINIARKIYHETLLGNILLRPLKNLINLIQFNPILDRIYITKKFKQTFKYNINLSNPKSFNEKIQWLKLNDRSPLHTQCADKYAVRKIISNEGGLEFLIPLLIKTNDIDFIREDNMPNEPFVIKTNHDSGNIFIINDKTQVNYSHIRECLKHSMRHNYYYSSREWSYKHIKPIILIEKLISDNTGLALKDYKVLCFNGEPHYIQVESNRFSDHRSTTYNTLWKEQGFSVGYPPQFNIPQPPHFKKMLELAKILAKPFPFVRVDFYDTKENLYIGEITFHPNSGFGIFNPTEWDNILGNELTLQKTTHY